MLPVVLRFSHSAWGFALPAATAVLTALLAWTWLSSRHTASRSATLIMASTVLLTTAATLYGVRRPIVPAPLVIHAFGLFLCSAAWGAWGTAGYAVKELGLERAKLPAAFVACAVGALLGARLLFVLTVPIAGWRESLALHQGGLSLWGGVLGGTLAVGAWCRRTQQAFWQWSPALAPAALVAIAIGRVGCFASGSHFGRALLADAWPVLRGLGTYPRWSDSVMTVSAGPPVWLAQVERQEIPAIRLLSNPTHPVQLYEVLALGVVLAVVIKSRQWWSRPRELCCGLTFVYAVIAFSLEWLRGDAERGFLGPSLRPAMPLAGSTLLFVGLLVLLLRSVRHTPAWRVRVAIAFVAAHGLLMWVVAAQLGEDHARVVRLSVAQVSAVLAAACSALAAAGSSPRVRLPATASAASLQ
jgi:prolipoprotein diacylglyceryltransferase